MTKMITRKAAVITLNMYKTLKTGSRLLVASFFISTSALADSGVSSLDQCLLNTMKSADSAMTIGEARASCEKPQGKTADSKSADVAIAAKTDAFEARRQQERETQLKPFVMTPHKQNYLLIGAYTKDPNNGPYDAAYPDGDYTLDNWETMFQISFKFPVWTEMFGSNGNLFVAYTQRSFWQVYNTDISSPFRENNFEPEGFLSFDNDWELGGGWKNSLNKVGIVHQSNGQTEGLSRSWNRVYVETFLINPDYNIYFSLKPWAIVGDIDDNPDIKDFMGNFEFKAVYQAGQHNIGLMTRNNLSSDNKGALQLDWSFPLYKHLRGYVQAFHGYGYSLIDYNANQNVLGIGFELTDYL
jgi:phospholipase A1